MRALFDITEANVKDPLGTLGARQWWKLKETMGRLLPCDIGKRVYQHSSGIYQVESEEQRDKRLRARL